MCDRHKPVNGFWSGVGFAIVMLAILFVCLIKTGVLDAKAHTPVPASKRFSQTTVGVSGTKVQVLVDNVTGVACYRNSENYFNQWSCATIAPSKK